VIQELRTWKVPFQLEVYSGAGHGFSTRRTRQRSAPTRNRSLRQHERSRSFSAFDRGGQTSGGRRGRRTRDLVVGSLHGWTGRGVGRGPHLRGGGVTHNGESKTRTKNVRFDAPKRRPSW
jgi:hypothetical protein